MNDITLVTMFYNIGRESWDLYPRKVAEYINAFEVFLNYDYNMVIFVDDRYYNQLNEKLQNSDFKHNKQLIPINEQWLFDNLWSWSRLDQETKIMNSKKYKSLVAHRIARSYPENINPSYTILTHSKIDVVNYVIENNLTDSKYLAWVDFGYFYDKTTAEFLPNDVLDINKLNTEKFNICLIQPITPLDKDYLFTLHYAPEKIGAYFFFGSKQIMKEFQQLSHKWLIKFQEEYNIADDEQAVWLQCYFDNPDLFELHNFGKWHQALREFSK